MVEKTNYTLWQYIKAYIALYKLLWQIKRLDRDLDKFIKKIESESL